jgi:hypothetical protein
VLRLLLLRDLLLLIARAGASAREGRLDVPPPPKSDFQTGALVLRKLCGSLIGMAAAPAQYVEFDRAIFDGHSAITQADGAMLGFWSRDQI